MTSQEEENEKRRKKKAKNVKMAIFVQDSNAMIEWTLIKE